MTLPEKIKFEFLNIGFAGLTLIDQTLQNIVELHIDGIKYAIRFPHQLADTIPSFSVLRLISDNSPDSSLKILEFEFLTKGSIFPASKGHASFEISIYYKKEKYLMLIPAELEKLIPHGSILILR